MTVPANMNLDGESAKTPALVESGPSGVEPFLSATGGKTEPKTPRALGSRLLDYSAHAAMIVGLVGFAWTVSNHVVKRPTAAQIESSAHAAAQPTHPKADELADLRHTNQQMADDIRRLRSSLDTLRASVHEDKTPAQLRVLQAGLENVQSGLATTRTETSGAVAQLNGKLEKIEHEPGAKVQQLSDRVSKLEKGGVDLTSTASIPAMAAKGAAVPTPPVKPVPAKLASAEDARRASNDLRRPQDEPAAKPQVIAGYVVRDVYQGVALIEGRRGQMEVVPGVGIPGAGIVKSIDRRGNGWVVTTSKGVLAYAAPPRDYRRASYPAGYRYDF